MKNCYAECMELRGKILNRIVTITRVVIRRVRTLVYKWFPGVPRFLERYLPQFKARLGEATRIEYRDPDVRARDNEVISLLTNYSYQQIVELMIKEEAREIFVYLRSCGFKKTADSIDFKIIPCDLRVDPKSLVEIKRVDDGDIEIRIDFFRVRNSDLLLGRLINFLTGYWNGIEKILDHELNEHGRMSFYLCLEDSYGIDSKQQLKSSSYAFSRPKQSIDVGLVPDPYALANLNSSKIFPDLRDIEKARTDFSDRKEKIFWRGSTTGHFKGAGTKNNQRVIFCTRSLEFPNFFDVSITSAVEYFDTKSRRKKLTKSGIMGDVISESEFANFMAYLDLEGNASAWGTFGKYLQHIHIMKAEGEFSHFFDFFQEAGSHTPFTNFDYLLERLNSRKIIIGDFDVAHRGYLSALNALEIMASGDATVFPIPS